MAPDARVDRKEHIDMKHTWLKAPPEGFEPAYFEMRCEDWLGVPYTNYSLGWRIGALIVHETDEDIRISHQASGLTILTRFPGWDDAFAACHRLQTIPGWEQPGEAHRAAAIKEQEPLRKIQTEIRSAHEAPE